MVRAKMCVTCFSCGCNLAMSLNTDYDECSHDDWNDCNDEAECNNTIGSYDCKCNVGYTGDGRQCEGALKNCFHNSAFLREMCCRTFTIRLACYFLFLQI